MYLGIEIGGTKLQLGLGAGDGVIEALWRGTVVPADGANGIRRQITQAIPELLASAKRKRDELRGVGIGFGGPVDDATRTVIKSHQIAGWDGFPLADWIADLVGLPAALGNDADVAGLAEALFGAGKGLSPIFYITIGSGIGGGLIINGEIYRGCGRGAAEIGHLAIHSGEVIPMPDSFKQRVPNLPNQIVGSRLVPVESVSSGWGIGRLMRERITNWKGYPSVFDTLSDEEKVNITAADVCEAAMKGDKVAAGVLEDCVIWLGEAVTQMITLICPRRIVIGGGVSLIGEELLFKPLREEVADRVFKPFADCYDIVPACLGEAVVVHGALALARQRLAWYNIPTINLRFEVAMIVALKTEKSLMTVDAFYDFVNRRENEARSFELVRGEVIEVFRPTRLHCRVCMNVGYILETYTRKKRKGYVVCNDTGVVLDQNPDTVRGPDIAYFEDAERWEDLPGKWGDTVPRLIVEVLSPNDGAQYMNDKITEYLRSGVEVVWVIDPDSKRVAIYSKNEGVKSFTEKQTITGGDVLPGFRCRVADFFVLPAGTKKPKPKRPT